MALTRQYRTEPSMQYALQVVSEISVLIDRLRQVASTAVFPGSAVKARDPDSLLPRAGKEKVVYDFLVSSGYAKVCRGLEAGGPVLLHHQKLSACRCPGIITSAHACTHASCSQGMVARTPLRLAPRQPPHGHDHLLPALVQAGHLAAPQRSSLHSRYSAAEKQQDRFRDAMANQPFLFHPFYLIALL